MSHFYTTIIQPFFKSSEKFADRNAFCIDEVFYTYQQLRERIEILHSLVKSSKSDVVGIVTHDHLDTYAAIWAVWLTGKSYVPLNPLSPEDLNLRIKQQLNLDLILDPKETGNLSKSSTDIFSFWSNFSKSDFDDTRLVYILFTSGSTGVPKGVPIQSGNLAAFVEAFWRMGYQIAKEDKALQMFELTFDLSVMSYLIPQLKGGCVYTVPKDCLKFAYIYDLLTEQELTIALMVPSMLKLLRPYFEEIECPKLKYSLFCGEALHADLIDLWKICVPNARIDNVYGPTENTIFCTYYTCLNNESMDSHNGVLSIGKSMANNDCKVFNDLYEVAQPNEIGELCLSGLQLTPGYLDNEELNRGAFFWHKDPDTGTQVRYYKTGDLCVELPNGNINFIGRKDSQVKIQGFRVELAEIEFQAKSGLDSFKNMVCILVEDKNENNEIVLMIEGQPFDLNVLRAHLKETLPWYMIPKDVLFMDSFPLNSSGKIDKRKIRSTLLLEGYSFRVGSIKDISFIVDSIISAEKGNSEVLGLANLFDINESELKLYLMKMLNEEIEGCEFSAANFIITETKGMPVAALCAWIEGVNEFEQPSSVLKTNLLGRTLGVERMRKLEQHKELLEQIRLTRTPGVHQVEYVYVQKQHRGRDLIRKMIDYSYNLLKYSNEQPSEVEVFANNLPAIKAYAKLGYVEVQLAKANPTLANKVLPYFEKIKMMK